MKTLRGPAGLPAIFIAATLVAGCGSISIPSTTTQAGAGSGTSDGASSGGSNGASSGSGNGGSNGPSNGSGNGSGQGAGSGGSGTGSGSGSGSGGSGSAGSGSGGSGTGSDGGSTGSGNGGSSGGGAGSGTGSDGSGSGGSGSGNGSGGLSGALALVPADAIRVSAIQTMNNWEAAYDSGTSGTSGSASGTMAVVDAPSLSGQAREFTTSYTNSGGERYWAAWGQDTQAKHFLYDTWVYLDSSASSIANLEMDTNQVMANGETVIFGFQCDGYTKTWDYTMNSGTPENFQDEWVHSSAACDLQSWSLATWHHLQVLYSRDDAGNVTYESVWLDDAEEDIEATVPSAFALGWGPTLLSNVQVDGLGANGSSQVYLDQLTVYRW